MPTEANQTKGDDQNKPDEHDAKTAELSRDVLDHPHFKQEFKARFDDAFKEWMRSNRLLMAIAGSLMIGLASCGYKSFNDLNEEVKRKSQTLTASLENLDAELSKIGKEVAAAKLASDLVALGKTQSETAASIAGFAKGGLDRVDTLMRGAETKLGEVEKELAYLYKKAEQDIQNNSTAAQNNYKNLSNQFLLLSQEASGITQQFDEALEGRREAKQLTSEIVALESRHPTAIQMPDVEPPYTNKYVLKFWSGNVNPRTTIFIQVTCNGVPLNPEAVHQIYEISTSSKEIMVKDVPGGAQFRGEDYIPRRIPIMNTPFSFSSIRYIRRRLAPDLVFFKVFYRRPEDLAPTNTQQLASQPKSEAATSSK